jgi:acetyl-CoA carboxylase alpha subunit
MRDYGEIDYHRKRIRVNKKESRKYGKKHKTAGILDSIVHEEMHRTHPKMTEKTVRKKTKRKIKKMSKRVKKKHYSRYKG